jgi:phospho-N-acetylmuramoyl-pentapeptide-transferase
MNNKALFQPIRSDGPQSHIVAKKKTPTMGGIFIILATILSTILFVDYTNSYIIIISMIMFSFAIIGLVDDLLKVLFKNTNGFRGSYKLVIQFVIIGIAILWLGYVDLIHLDNKIFIPVIDYHITLLTILYILFVNFVIVGTSNAVNLTDGLDGLVSVPAIINLVCLIILIYCVSSPKIADYLQITHIKFSGEIIFLCLSLIGSIFGFLMLNLKPAKIFMGDVGSLAIGSTLGLIAIIIKQEIIFFIISLVFVAESLSVIIQVTSYKIRKKRIFLMAPLHHHFEKLGWDETKVVKAFWASSFFFACLGMIIFLI